MADYKIKVNKKHLGKEFKSGFRYIGKVSSVNKKDPVTDSWEKQPIYTETLTKTKKPRRVLQFDIETAESNKLRVELAGMEQQYAYAYSRSENKTLRLDWKDRSNKEAFTNDSYHAIEVDWDKSERLGKLVQEDEWYEVRGQYQFDTFTPEGSDAEKVFIKRIINSVRPIKDGLLVNDDGTTQTVKHSGVEFDYVTDFKSSEFKEVNYVTMQVGIRSTYQDDVTGDTKVNAVFLDYGKEKSEPKAVEMIVYQTEAVEGKKSLADAFASLNTYDFIEITGQDNNRATFTYVDIVEKIDESDPFSDVDESQKLIRKEKVTNGDKKGIEVTGYVTNSLMRELLTEEEFKKAASTTTEDPFSKVSSNATSSDDQDPFAV
ncbi:hypothetical protein [Paenibacillus sp. Marseille-Q4541]|uniref:hypothetical protein n=1 Tax=Paenibacillus sp. Marseille-Q4541 TaxID=2831522 RepID=UPI001BA7E5A1|nr:hypothetical protein [Paenibacillus sp. Marseille-Q4541]